MLVLGIAGWLLQTRTQDARETQERNDWESRRYLPVIRTLTDLEIVAGAAHRMVTERNGVGVRESAYLIAASSLDSASALLFVTDLEPATTVELPNLASLGGERQMLKLPLRGTAFMAADILKLVSLADTHAVDEPHAPTADIGFGFNGDSPVGRVRFWNPRESVIEMPARRESVDAWVTWCRGESSNLYSVERAIPSTLRGLQEQATRATQTIMRDHPDLGEQYVAIRADATAARRLIQ